MDKTNSETDRQAERERESGKRGDREEGETGREVSSTEEGEMWEQEGGEIMLVAPVLCVRVCMCVNCTHVSGYAAHRKQTAAKSPPSSPHTNAHTHTHTHTRKYNHKRG